MHTHHIKLFSFNWVLFSEKAFKFVTLRLAVGQPGHTTVVAPQKNFMLRSVGKRSFAAIRKFILCVSYGKFLVEWKWSNEYLCACTLTNFVVHVCTKHSLAFMCVLQRIIVLAENNWRWSLILFCWLRWPSCLFDVHVHTYPFIYAVIHNLWFLWVQIYLLICYVCF